MEKIIISLKTEVADILLITLGSRTVKRQSKQKLNELVSNKEQTLIELIQEIGVQEAIERLQKRK